MEIIRKTYVEEILTLKDKPFIKVITGVRRCGKSTILKQYRNLLVEQYKISKSNIISYDFNEPKFSQYSYMKLYKEIVKKSNKTQINYIFLDEIQEIDKFEKCVIGLYEHKKIKFDIYLTGSNSKMFSSSLASLLTGRNIEINIFPLSFKEYYEFAQKQLGANNRHIIFQYYLKYGGLPIIIPIFNDNKTVERALSAVLKDSVDKDVKTRHEIRNYPEFLRLANYILENIGQDFSTRSISNYLKSNNLSKTSHHTVDTYLS
jgi:predicted AAA+ superfamily ATPase